VHDDDDRFRGPYTAAARALNLKPHGAGDTGTIVIGPCDIEGHRGNDGRYD
jgi:hypothetical protein